MWHTQTHKPCQTGRESFPLGLTFHLTPDGPYDPRMRCRSSTSTAELARQQGWWTGGTLA